MTRLLSDEDLTIIARVRELAFTQHAGAGELALAELCSLIYSGLDFDEFLVAVRAWRDRQFPGQVH